VGGFFPAAKEYLERARALTLKHGALLIFDEIVSGFRFAATGLQRLYGVRPDLSAFGKIIGGGHAVAAVIGDRRIMEGCERAAGGRHRVLFEGGTFSAHSEYMKAGLIMLGHLVRNAASIYPRLARAGDRLRKGIERVFTAEGVEARCSGAGSDVVPGSSLFMVHFQKRGTDVSGPQDILDDRRSDVALREEILKLALLVHGVNVVHGGGAISVSHREQDLRRTIEAYGETAKLFRKFLA